MHLKRAVPLLFFLSGGLLLIFGLGALGAAFILPGTGAPDLFAWKPPLEQVDNRTLAPATALLPLTGMRPADALNAALDQGHWDNAFALIAYDPSLSDATRIGALLQLGTRYTAAKQMSQAAAAFEGADRIATLSPFLSDRVRQDTYLQVSAGLRSMQARDAAHLAVDQAFLVAQYSPVLRWDPSPIRFTQVANAYAALGAQTLADHARALGNEAANAKEAEETLLPREPFSVTLATLPASAEVDAARQTRMAAAQQLLNDVQDNPPKRAQDWPQDSLAQLSQALVSEDRVRLDYYDKQLAASKEPAVQLALLTDKVNWLALKYRIARGAFGVGIVQAWEKDAPATAEAYSQAWGDLFRLYEHEAESIPNAQAVSQASEDVLRQELLALRWGWYRGTTEQDLHTALAGVSGQLRDASIVSLRVDLLTRSGKSLDLLVPDELYGKNDQALPK